MGENGIDTVRRVRAELKRNNEQFFIIGIDAFLDLAKWREPVALLREAEFIVASRPGYSLGDIGDALQRVLASAGAGAPFPAKAGCQGRSRYTRKHDPLVA